MIGGLVRVRGYMEGRGGEAVRCGLVVRFIGAVLWAEMVWYRAVRCFVTACGAGHCGER